MRVLVWHGPRILKIEEAAEPAPGPDEVLIKVQAVGICGSEIEGYLSFNSLRVPPLIMGHEFCGEVVASGAGVAPDAGRRGQYVAVNPLVSCGECHFCRAGLAHLCPSRKLIGAHRPGGFADYVVVPARALVPLSENLEPQKGALVEPFAVALHGVGIAGVTPADGVVVWGAGSIGLLTICAARQAQPARIIAVDTNAARLEQAKAMGADIVLDARADDVVASIRRHLADRVRTVVLDAVGRAVTRQAAVAAAGPGGRVVLLGLHDRDTTFDVSDIIRSEVALLGSYGYSMQDVQRAAELLAAGAVPSGPWLEVRNLEQGPESFEELVDRPGVATKIVLVP
ncbi:MAG: alcohol dehydrogenase catalytic domain-containing protein [Ktedonobacteraceae bacterium]|nr:alcohol dehydrogenase catalytic domain-containing protein [Ktedonobacteraceae bacterium]